MDLSANGEAKQIVKNGVGQERDISGWLFRLIQEGWLRKRWRKRWCIVKHDKLFMYEFEPTNHNEDKECGMIELEYYQKCINAPKKECKKSPNTFIVELTKTEEKNKQKNKAAPQREMFYAENESDKDRWLAHLNDKIAAARLGYAKTLDHVTKSRPKPSSNQRRPPSRNHLRERASQSEVLSGFDEEVKVKIEPVKRGHVPTTAIKPPPGGAKPKLESNPSSSNEVPPSPTNEPEERLSKMPPKPPMKPKYTSEEEQKPVESPAKVMPGTPPPAPPKALKPKLLNLSVGEAITEEEEIENEKKLEELNEDEILIAEGVTEENSDEECSPPNEESPPASPLPETPEGLSASPLPETPEGLSQDLATPENLSDDQEEPSALPPSSEVITEDKEKTTNNEEENLSNGHIISDKGSDGETNESDENVKNAAETEDATAKTDSDPEVELEDESKLETTATAADQE